MSDTFEMLVDTDATEDQAPGLALAVLDSFKALGLITGNPTSECVLAAQGYYPGAAVRTLYTPSEGEGAFWTLVTCGVEARVGRDLNVYAIAEVGEGLTCSNCATTFEDCGAFGHSLGDAIQQWFDRSGPGLLSCPRCGGGRPIDEWDSTPHLGFGNLSFCFWNWPPLVSPAWKIDIAGVVREVTGHGIVRTYGRI